MQLLSLLSLAEVACQRRPHSIRYGFVVIVDR
jgi:hypothetical protein